MKSICSLDGQDLTTVAPFTGAWIEIDRQSRKRREYVVAPFTGAWIEIRHLDSVSYAHMVAPFTGAWIEIGAGDQLVYTDPLVAPFTGAWIEMANSGVNSTLASRRSLHGSVD